MDEQKVNVTGSDNQVNVAGRDVIQDSQINVFQQFQTTEYFEPKLDQYKPPEFPEPRCANRIHGALLERRVVLIGDSPEIDKSALCRHFAWRLRETLTANPSGAQGGVAAAVQEWGRGTGTPNLVLTLRQTEKRTIFILPQIKPQDVGYDLRRLADAARDCEHYVIASTEAPLQTWGLPPTDLQFWQPLSPADVYEPDALAEILSQKLGDAVAELKGLSHQDRFAPDRPLAGYSTIREISQRLRTPENISLFVRLLSAEKQQISAATVSRLIESAVNDQHTLGLWYRALAPRDQMLALGLSLFEQLFDDQFFAAFRYVVEDEWHHYDESLRAIDYRHLDELRNFFNLVQSGSHGFNIQRRFPDQRRKFFEAAWNSHRRQLKAALPVMVRLAKASVRSIGANRELYGTYERRDQIRRAVSDSISDIGLISPQDVEEHLLKLAADWDWAIQAIAARAIARWRAHEGEKGKEHLLIQTVKKWEQGTQFLKIISSFIEGEGAEQKEDPIYYIRATIALTVGYAAYYDPPNQFSQELCELLKELANDRNRFVRQRFCEFTLPVVTRLHLRQLKDMLWEMAAQNDLIEPIAWNLAEAHRISPGEVDQTLEEWESRLLKNLPPDIKQKDPGDKDPSDYEKRLAAVVLTYGWIEYDEGKSEKVFKLLQHILIKVKSAFVHRAVTIAISRQAKQDFEKVAPKIQQLMTYVEAQERNEIVAILDDVYLDQRSSMKEGDGGIEAGDPYTDARTDGKRPLTAIERVMNEWVKDSRHRAAQQIAIQTQMAFIKSLDQEAFIKSLDQEKNRKNDRLLRKRRQGAERINRIAPQASIQPKEYVSDSYTIWVLWFVSRNKSDGLSSVLEGIFHEVLEQRASDRYALELVMERWRRSSDPELAEIARGLDRAIWWRDHKGAVLGLSLVGLITLLLILYFVLSSFRL